VTSSAPLLPEGASEEANSQPTAQSNQELNLSSANQADTSSAEFKPSLNGKALLFSPFENGMEADSLQVRWGFKKGDQVNFDGFSLKADEISFEITQTARTSVPGDLQDKNNKSKAVSVMAFSWPTQLSTHGKITFETETGAIKWSLSIEDEDRKDWQELLLDEDLKFLKPHSKSAWGIIDPDLRQFKFLFSGETHRLCLNEIANKNDQLKICSAPFVASLKGSKVELKLVNQGTENTSTLYINDQPIGASGLAYAKVGKSISLKPVFSNGSFVSFKFTASPLDLIDAVESRDGKLILISGRGKKPIGKAKDLNLPETGPLAATGLPLEPLWQLVVPRSAPLIRTMGEFNMPMTYFMKFEKLPKAAERIYIEDEMHHGTYSSSPVLKGYAQPKQKLSSKDYSIERIDAEKFEWTFAAPKKGTTNRSNLLIKNDEGQSWVASHSLHRTYPFEASIRLTGAIDPAASIIFLGEAAMSVWLESLGPIRNSLIGSHRWGINTRYFQTATPIKLANTGQSSHFSVANLDLRYNLTRGLWNRDELIGVILSMQQNTLSNYTTTLNGLGAYWARTMPKVFNDIFEVLPLFRYPKYVDMDLVIYQGGLSSSVQTQLSYHLNFHGKVFWTDRFYGEAGFGLKRLEFATTDGTNRFALGMTYGTVGMGVVF
jgi:hypothetical protein